MRRKYGQSRFSQAGYALVTYLIVAGSADSTRAQQATPAAANAETAPAAQPATPPSTGVQPSPEKQSVAVPVVMEEATVRGKVAILETRREDRKLIEGLPVQVWSTTERQHTSRVLFTTKTHSTYERNQLLRETKTDEMGLFDLPLLTPGEYILVISEVQFRLSVVPQSQQRRGQSEPKVLLILIPKEVVAKESGEAK